MSTPGARIREQREERSARLAEQEGIVLIRSSGPTQQVVAHQPHDPELTVCGERVVTMEPLHPLTTVPPRRVCERCFPNPTATAHRLNIWLNSHPA